MYQNKGSTTVKAVLSSILKSLVRHGSLTVTWPDRTSTTFSGRPGPQAGLVFMTWLAVRRVAANPGLALGEMYMDGTLAPAEGDLYGLLDVLVLNLQEGSDHPVLRLWDKIGFVTRKIRQRNNVHQARQHVAHHYDLDSRLYSLILDSDQQYSCAYFRCGNETLEEAQRAKKDLIAAKLRLNRPGLHVLDIGCGWGGMALTLALDYGARVTGITLSEEQRNLAEARAAALNLSDRVRFELADYRNLRERYDRIVSVGMMEHVGLGNYATYFQSIHDCLTDDGVALIHHIGRSDGPGVTSSWLRKYIFPGGYSPALSEVTPAIERSGLMITDIEVLRLHYAQTLRLWRERFVARRDDVRGLYDERFCRMFEFYLVGAELAFRRGREVVFQTQLTREQDTLPLNRDYMFEAQPILVERMAAD